MRRRTLVLGLLVMAVALGACGLPADDEPQAIATENLPPDLIDPNPGSSTTLPPSGATTTVVVYLLEETAAGVRLAEAEREVTQAAIPDERLAALFAGTTEEETDSGLRTQIPAGTVLLSVETDPDADEVVVDVSSDLLAVEGPALAQAFAQIVYTATEPSAGGFTRVRFLIDGESSTVLDGNGVEQDGPVTRASYSALSPPR